jgi:hypothetical protein
MLLELVYFGRARALELKLYWFWDVYVHAFGKNYSILEFNIIWKTNTHNSVKNRNPNTYLYKNIYTFFWATKQTHQTAKPQTTHHPRRNGEKKKKKTKKKRKTHKSYHLLRLRSAAYCESGTTSESGVDRGVGSGEFLQTGHEPFSFSQASRCVVAAVVVVVVVAVGGTGVGAATEIAGEEDGGDFERRVERMERSEIRLSLGSLIFNRWIWKNN